MERLNIAFTVCGFAICYMFFEASFFSDYSSSNVVKINATYDYVIIGGGSAGSVLASRLSEDPDVSVLVLEAGGGEDTNWMYHEPSEAFNLAATDANWEYDIEPQENACFAYKGNSVRWLQGRVLGGSSITNYMLYARGSYHDYDAWAANGCVGWSSEDVVPYFLKSEDLLSNVHISAPYHQSGGPLAVTEMTHTPLQDVFFKGGQELGYSIIDINSGQEGFGRFQGTIRNGKRSSTSREFLRPAMSRRNVQVSLKSIATKVLFKDKHAYGVDIIRNNRKRTINATIEVILCAGAIKSAQLLMVSGVGPSDHLQKLKIPVVHDLPVGRNLKNHMAIILNFGMNRSSELTLQPHISLSEYFSGLRHFQIPLMSGMASVQVDRENSVVTYPDFAIMMMGLNLPIFGCKDEFVVDCMKTSNAKGGFTIFLVSLKPQSSGWVELKTMDPFDSPEVDPQYLSNPEDVRFFVKGLRFVEQLINTTAFRSIGANINDLKLSLCKDHEFRSDSYWECLIRHLAGPMMHQYGTCKMAATNDREAVVDPRLKVKGMEGLRVVDTSVIPNCVTGYTHAVAIMIAEKAADMIKLDRIRS